MKASQQWILSKLRLRSIPAPQIVYFAGDVI